MTTTMNTTMTINNTTMTINTTMTTTTTMTGSGSAECQKRYSLTDLDQCSIHIVDSNDTTLLLSNTIKMAYSKHRIHTFEAVDQSFTDCWVRKSRDPISYYGGVVLIIIIMIIIIIIIIIIIMIMIIIIIRVVIIVVISPNCKM
ncbi:hypothetical protein MBLNU459_g1214t2 [Dothideomycetes sp. NU459]